MGILEILGCRKRAEKVVEIVSTKTTKAEAADPIAAAQTVATSSLENGVTSNGKPPKEPKVDADGERQADSDNESFDDEFKRTMANQDGFDETFEQSLDNFDEMWPSVNDVVHDRLDTGEGDDQPPVAAAAGEVTEGEGKPPKVNGVANGHVPNGTKGDLMVEENIIDGTTTDEDVLIVSEVKPAKRNTWSPPGAIDE